MFAVDGPADLEGEFILRIDGTLPLTAASVQAVEELNGKAEDHATTGTIVVYLSGAPEGDWTRDLSVALVNKWERAVRRFERLPMTTIAVASGIVGGKALDLLLATDYRIAAPDLSLVVAVGGEATWPGMALYRLTQQAGMAATRRAVLFGEALDADDALAARLVDEVVPDQASALVAVAAAFSGFSGQELAIRRRLAFDATTVAFEEALGSHLAAVDRTLRQAEESSV
jgi:isomerase DpgB